MSFPSGHLSEHPLPTGIVGALGLGGYQLLADIAGVGAGRLGSHAFLLVAPEPDPRLPDAGTQLALHHSKLREDSEVSAFVALAAQLGYLRLSGYRLALERSGMRSNVSVVDPASGAVVLTIPDRHPGRFLGGGLNAARLLAAVRLLPPAGAPPDPQNSDMMRQVLLALALQDDALTGAQAAEVSERALALLAAQPALEPPAALEAAKQQES